MRKGICVGLFMIMVYWASAQVSVAAAFSQDTILIGNTVDYTVTIKTFPSVNILQVEKNSIDSIISGIQTQKLIAQDSTVVPDPIVSDYDVMDYGKWDDKNEDGIYEGDELGFDITNVGNETLYENTFKIKFWDAGPQYLKHPGLMFQSGDSLYQMPPSGVAELFIAPPFDLAELENDSIDIAPIKDIVYEKKNISDYFIYMWIAGILLGLFLLSILIKYLNKPKVVEEVQVEIKRPAHEIAIEKLHDLGDKELWQKGEIKAYQSELTYIIREYLENRYDIMALESTTDEIVKELGDKEFDPTDEKNLREILQVADLVKFAKAKPEASMHQRFLDSALGFVRKTKANIVEEVEEQNMDTEV